MSILGLHHVSLVCASARRTLDFYAGVLGLQPVQQTVPLAAAETDHLYFGSAAGPPGAWLTFRVQPAAPEGRRGIGAVHHVAFCAPDRPALRRWKRRLTDLGMAVKGPYQRNYFESIYFRDPDGVILEIATRGPGWTVDEPAAQLGLAVQPPPDPHLAGQRDEGQIGADTWPDPVPAVTSDMALQGLHHVTALGTEMERTARFYDQLLGLRPVKRTFNFDNPRTPHWYLAPAGGAPGSIISYFAEGHLGTARARPGRGLTDHVAFAVAGAAELAALRERVSRHGIFVSPVMDRVCWQSFSFTDPDGLLLEVATA